jgi:tetratricopeptide (TPR) repeat protein
MKYPLLLGFTTALILSAHEAIAQSPKNLEQIAKKAAIEIKVNNTSMMGSGVIIHRQGNVYTLMTNRHVVCGKAGPTCKALPLNSAYSIGTADGRQYQVKAQSVKLLGKDLDLAIVQFRSSQTYQVASIAAPNSLKLNDPVYVAGFSAEQQRFNFSKGRAIAVVNTRLTADKGGYTVVYDTFTLPGMSGSGVYNNSGQLVAIHGLGERFVSGTEIDDDSRLDTKIGINRGVPIRWALQELAKIGLQLGGKPLVESVTPTIAIAKTADEYFIVGFNKFVNPGNDVQAGKKEAIRDFTTAISLNPKYAAAYFLRAYIYYQLQEFDRALIDMNKVIQIVPDYSRAYNNRGLLKAQRQDLPGALADLNRGLQLDPQNDLAYVNRGFIRKLSNDSAGALQDYNQAIKINPRLSEAYAGRGALYFELNYLPKALADFDQAIAINPNLAVAYYNRAAVKLRQKDLTGTLSDFNKAIELNSSFADAYQSRALFKRDQLKDRAGAIQDFQRAAQLYRQQGRRAEADRMLRIIKILGRGSK